MSIDEKIGPECFGGTDYPDLPLERDPFAGPVPERRREADPIPHGMPSAHRMIVQAPYGAKIRSLLGAWLDGPPRRTMERKRAPVRR